MGFKLHFGFLCVTSQASNEKSQLPPGPFRASVILRVKITAVQKRKCSLNVLHASLCPKPFTDISLFNLFTVMRQVLTILKVKELRPRNIRLFNQGHTARKWQTIRTQEVQFQILYSDLLCSLILAQANFCLLHKGWPCQSRVISFSPQISLFL